MRWTDFIIVIMASLIYLVPTLKQEKIRRAGTQSADLGRSPETREAQEEKMPSAEAPLAAMASYRIGLAVQRPEEESIADILWMKKAAAVAIEKGAPYFTVRGREIRRRYDPDLKRPTTVVDGIIDLGEGPGESAYDAEEILSLALEDMP